MGIVQKDVTRLAVALPGMEKWITLPAEAHCGSLNKPGGDSGKWMDLKPFHKMGTNCARFRSGVKVSGPDKDKCPKYVTHFWVAGDDWEEPVDSLCSAPLAAMNHLSLLLLVVHRVRACELGSGGCLGGVTPS